ncbi:MAG TPA: hypothetical protein H9816_04710 [Candidatus Tidjanibacter faecipullorum]|uniref:Uncharacterized protein n=1 Tax=Candidatus Tidjanibacter faecipullorum TaxID=2838766 RepID=A0A9D2DE46_9BACT|nr:hypothetical protein [Candidatus Tidjanibacter faecipullorum]
MKKQVIIIAAAVLAAEILGVLFFAFTPVWVSILAVVGINLGLVSGWIGHNLFLRYVKCE